MSKDSLFIVIEGLDGSGKTTASKNLEEILETSMNKKVKVTFEPNDDSCGGDYIRDVLSKKVTAFTLETLAYAFAANRLDHCSRVINPWLEEGNDKIILCDRYYLSSMVYQSNENLSMEEVLDLNRFARKPDIIFFMNVSNEVCYERMKVRNQPEELFEKNLSETRDKYFAAIDFLLEHRNEHTIIIDANGTVEEVVSQMIAEIKDYPGEWQTE